VKYVSVFCLGALISCLPPPKTRTTGPAVSPVEDTDLEKEEKARRASEEADRVAREEAEKLAAKTGENPSKPDQPTDVPVNATEKSLRVFVASNAAGQFKNCFSYKLNNGAAWIPLHCNKNTSPETCVPPAAPFNSAGILLPEAETASALKLSFQFDKYIHLAQTCSDASGGIKQYKYAKSPSTALVSNNTAQSADLAKNIKCGKAVVQRNGKSFTRLKICFEDNIQYDSSFNDFTVVLESENPALDIDFAPGCKNPEILQLADTVCK
jgi:hypothetical protein